MSVSGVRQLALDLPHAESFRRDDFLPSPSNASALALVDAWPVWPDRITAIVGPAGSGKSHLAAIWAERAGARIAAASSLTRDRVPRELATGALVLEDLSPDAIDETAVFHLLNLAREEGAFMLITAQSPADLAAPATPDLASRLRALPVIKLAAPDDALVAAVLIKLFADRQTRVDEDTVAYLLPRIGRSLSAARRIVNELDHASLAHGRRVSRALAAAWFREQKTLF